MIYESLFDQDPKHRWIFFFKGKQWNPPSSSPLFIADKQPWRQAPKHQIGLFKACRQTQAEIRRLVIDTGKDGFEFVGFNALDRFTRNYAYAKITSFVLVAELQHWDIRPGRSHSEDLDNLVALFEKTAFSNLKRMAIEVKDRDRTFRGIMGSHWARSETLNARFRVVFADLISRLLPIVRRENMKLELCAATLRGRNIAMVSIGLSAEGTSVASLGSVFCKHTLRSGILTALGLISMQMDLDN